MARLLLCSLLLLSLTGCQEGTKPNPLRRVQAGPQNAVDKPKIPELPAKIEFGDPIAVPEKKTEARSEPTLYDRLGKAAGVKKLVDQYVDALMDTETPGEDIRKRFPDRTDLHKLLVALFSDLSDGPPLAAGKTRDQLYADLGFFETHHGLAIAELRQTLALENVSPADRDALLARLENLRKKTD